MLNCFNKKKLKKKSALNINPQLNLIILKVIGKYTKKYHAWDKTNDSFKKFEFDAILGENNLLNLNEDLRTDITNFIYNKDNITYADIDLFLITLKELLPQDHPIFKSSTYQFLKNKIEKN